MSAPDPSNDRPVTGPPRPGRLKLFFGAAPGVGKTFAMLEAARRALREGVDVVVGVLSTHEGSETEAMLADLPRLPPRPVEVRGKLIEEFDLHTALARRPGLLLIDELAHTNAPGSRNPRRWQDVQELIAAGICVHATLNVQQLESLNDVVAQITGVRVRDTVPDAVFERADEVELIDVPVEALLQRLHEGKVHLPEQMAHATETFFRKGNLLALRELALRRLAQRVDSDVQAYRQEHRIAATWPSSERVLVCFGTSPNGPRLVRAAFRMATGLRADWIALYVETPGLALADATARAQVVETQRLAEALGAEVAHVAGERIDREILAFARRRNVTRLLVGKPKRRRLGGLLGGSLVDDLVRGSGSVDVHVIAGDEAPDERPAVLPQRASPGPRAYVFAVGAVTLVTAASLLMLGPIYVSDVVLLYLAVITAQAVRFGPGPAFVTAALGVLALDYFFIEPLHSFRVSEPARLVTFLIMLAVGLGIASLTDRIRLQAEAARLHERRTVLLYRLSREFSHLRHTAEIASCAARHVGETIAGEAVVLLPGADGELAPAEGQKPGELDARELGIARWALEHGPAGCGTDTLPGGRALYLPLTAAGHTIGVLAVLPNDPERLRNAAERQILEAMCGPLALALQRVMLAQEAQQAELRARTEELRGSLLSSVSHDLRTPLASITGAASTMLQAGAALSAGTRRDLLQTIYDEAERLGRLVTNLLDMTRLEASAGVLRTDWTPLEEPIGAALARLEHRLSDRPVEVVIAPGLPLVPLDEVLFEQLVLNLIDNACKYTPPGTAIRISGRAEGGRVVMEVADRGPGIPPGRETAIFDKFVRGPATREHGFGLGLAICRAIAVAHGGAIGVENRPGGGAIFRVSIPLGAGPPAEALAPELDPEMSGLRHAEVPP